MSQSKTVSYHSWIWGGQSSDVSQLSRISTPLENWWCFVLLWGTRCLAESIHEWRFGASPRERSVAETPRQYVARELERTRGCGGSHSGKAEKKANQVLSGCSWCLIPWFLFAFWTYSFIYSMYLHTVSHDNLTNWSRSSRPSNIIRVVLVLHRPVWAVLSDVCHRLLQSQSSSLNRIVLSVKLADSRSLLGSALKEHEWSVIVRC